MTKEQLEGKTRILIVDDHPIVRQGLTQLINHEPDLTVAGESETADQALEVLRGRPFDLVIVDISLVGASGIELTEKIKLMYPDLPVLVLTMHDESIYARRALRAGADGYIVKREAPGTIISAIRQMLTGRKYISLQMAKKLSQTYFSGDAGR